MHGTKPAVSEVNESFWSHPPWQGGARTQRLGLKPIDPSLWLSAAPDAVQLNNKLKQLSKRYAEVVQVPEETRELDDMLCQLPWPDETTNRFPHLIADLALTVADDLCVIDVADQQRLVAACLCAPSYWHLLDKIGQPLCEVHAPVPGLNHNIGANIQRFIDRAPLGQPFMRRNWFLHGDQELFHNAPQSDLHVPVGQWIVRSEKQTLCRCSERYLLFTIQITCEPLSDIAHFPAAQRDMLKSLQLMDENEVVHFGGVAKCRQLSDYVENFVR